MIQRIQSIFLLLAATAAFCLFVFPFASTSEAVASSVNFSDSIFNIQDNIAMIILFCVAGGLAFISIFLYSDRKRQLLIGRLAIIANIIGLILAFAIYYNDSDQVAEGTAINDEMGLYLPGVFLLFALLSQHFINKDEKLVKSMDRLR